jgi:bacterioferritin-associated ferredoxin
MQPGMSRSRKSQHSTVRRRELQCQNPNNFNGVVMGVMRSGNIEKIREIRTLCNCGTQCRCCYARAQMKDRRAAEVKLLD